MTEPLAPHGLTAECLSCGGSFEPRKWGHVFCSAGCRHRGARPLEQRVPVDHEAVARLFDEIRDPEGRVRADDWHLEGPDSGWFELELCDTVERRRCWYRALEQRGRL